MKKLLVNPHIGLLLRLIVGATFLYSSLYKIREPATFARGVMDYHVLPSSLIIPFAVILPWVEAVTGVCLILGWFRRGSATVTLLMLGVFMVALTAAITRGLNISCGCFHATSEGSRVAWETLGRDVLLVLATLPLLFMPKTTFELVPRGIAFGRRSVA